MSWADLDMYASPDGLPPARPSRARTSHRRPAWLLALGLLAAGCDTPTPTPETAPPAASPPAPPAEPAPAAPAAPTVAVRAVDLAAFKNDYYAGKVPFLVDVRTTAEYAAGHVPKAVNIPLDQVEARAPELEPHRQDEIYVICESGGRSARAATLLADRGFRTVNVQGGTYAWRSDGQPVE